MVAPADKFALPGFYGRETTGECIAKNPRLWSGRRKSEGRKGSEAGTDQGEGETDGGRERLERLLRGEERPEGGRRKGSLGQWLRRKSTN